MIIYKHIPIYNYEYLHIHVKSEINRKYNSN